MEEGRWSSLGEQASWSAVPAWELERAKDAREALVELAYWIALDAELDRLAAS